MSTLIRYDQDGMELVIDNSTGEAFVTIKGYARMVGLSKQAISKRYEALSDAYRKTTKIETASGVQSVKLIAEPIFRKWIIRDSPDLAEKIMETKIEVFSRPSTDKKLKNENILSDKITEDFQIKKIVERFCKEKHLINNLCGTETSFRELDQLSELPGIYFVAATEERGIDDGSQVVYVGMSTNIWSRWRNHHKIESLLRLSEFLKQQKSLHRENACVSDEQLFVTPYYLPFTPINLIKEIEGEFIRQLKPLLNEKVPLAKKIRGEPDVHINATRPRRDGVSD